MMMEKTEELTELSVVMPVYQEAETVGQIIPRIVKVLKEENIFFEIIAVNDGSADETKNRLNELAQVKEYHLRAIHHPYNKGNGSSIRTGMSAARGRFVLCMDADGQHRPEDIGKLLRYRNDYDLVVGAREDFAQGRAIASKNIG